MKLYLFLGLGLLLTAACLPHIPLVIHVPNTPSGAEITFEIIGPCSLDCPNYRLAIYGDGTVVYEGVKEDIPGASSDIALGRHTSTIEPVVVDELIYEFGKANFFSLQEQYTPPTDVFQVVTVGLKIGEKSKLVEYGGGAPDTLIELIFKILEVTDAEQWLGRHMPQRPTSDVATPEWESPLATPRP